MDGRKGFITKHAKSSAALVSLGIHAVLILVAVSFVAVSVIQKEEKNFEAKPVNRPKMALKKLQVPVNVKKKKFQKPKLRKRIVVQPKMNQSMPDIKMPEISGIKGGLGSAGGGGLGEGGGLGFSMPEIEIFGVKSKGEKIYIILDSSPEMMYDEMGGIPAYTIIKNELVNILDGLPPTTLFNIIVYDPGKTFLLFENMVSANSANVAKVDQWLKPLNAVRPGMGSKDYGVGTLGPGGQENKENLMVGKFQKQREWYRPAMLAMKQQADAVFLLTCWWGSQWHDMEARDKDWYDTSAGRRWKESYEEAKRLLAEENKKRAARGEPPKVVRDHPWDMNREFFPDIEFPPVPEKYHYTSRDFVEAFVETRQAYKPKEVATRSGIGKKRSKGKVDFSFNVVHFREVGESKETHRHEVTAERFGKLTSLCKGEYRMIAGMEAIKSSVSRQQK